MASMQSEAAATVPSGPAFEVKGTIAPVTVLCLRSIDVDRIERELRARVEPAPQLFLNAPIVIDVADVEHEAVPLGAIVERVRRCKLVPVGVAHLPAEQVPIAAEIGLAVVQVGFGRSRGARANSSNGPVGAAVSVVEAVAKAREQARPASEPPAATHAAATTNGASANDAAVEPMLTMTVRQPVRSGQVLYAKASDLVVCAPVNAGAQVIADGHIHVYGRLKGRALAGAHGQADARVFCQSLEAELVSIAGEFLTADEIPAALHGRPAQIYVEHGELRVAPL